MPRVYEFTGSRRKMRAWATHQEIYRHFTGVSTLRAHQRCVSLCGVQRNVEGSQINRYQTMGFVRKTQYIGIDRDPWVISANKGTNPDAEFVCGDFVDRFAELVSRYEVGFVDLDTIALAGEAEALRLVTQTMRLCSPGTVLALNVQMQSRFRPAQDAQGFIQQLSDDLGDDVVAPWTVAPPLFFEYTSRRTPMGTFAFYYDPQFDEKEETSEEFLLASA